MKTTKRKLAQRLDVDEPTLDALLHLLAEDDEIEFIPAVPAKRRRAHDDDDE